MNFFVKNWNGNRRYARVTVGAEWSTGILWWKRHHQKTWVYAGYKDQWRNVNTGARAEGDVCELLEREWYLRNWIT